MRRLVRGQRVNEEGIPVCSNMTSTEERGAALYGAHLPAAEGDWKDEENESPLPPSGAAHVVGEDGFNVLSRGGRSVGRRHRRDPFRNFCGEGPSPFVSIPFDAVCVIVSVAAVSTGPCVAQIQMHAAVSTAVIV